MAGGPGGVWGALSGRSPEGGARCLVSGGGGGGCAAVAGGPGGVSSALSGVAGGGGAFRCWWWGRMVAWRWRGWLCCGGWAVWVAFESALSGQSPEGGRCAGLSVAGANVAAPRWRAVRVASQVRCASVAGGRLARWTVGGGVGCGRVALAGLPVSLEGGARVASSVVLRWAGGPGGVWERAVRASPEGDRPAPLLVGRMSPRRGAGGPGGRSALSGRHARIGCVGRVVRVPSPVGCLRGGGPRCGPGGVRCVPRRFRCRSSGGR